MLGTDINSILKRYFMLEEEVQNVTASDADVKEDKIAKLEKELEDMKKLMKAGLANMKPEEEDEDEEEESSGDEEDGEEKAVSKKEMERARKKWLGERMIKGSGSSSSTGAAVIPGQFQLVVQKEKKTPKETSV